MLLNFFISPTHSNFTFILFPSVATHISWKLSAIVLSPNNNNYQNQNQNQKNKNEGDDDDLDLDLDTPAFSEYLLTAAYFFSLLYFVLHVKDYF